MNEELLNASDEDFQAGMLSQAPVEQEPVTEVEPVQEEETPPAESSVVTEEPPSEEGETPPVVEGEVPPTPTESAEPIDYKAAYERITAPFKANGKDIVLNTPEEVIQMMQMGANYTRKMQSIAPHRKALMMLQNNELLDENKLAYLIDLNKKDPAAIQKLLKESNIDPLEVDVTAESTYTPGNHHVSDEQVALTTVLEDITSTQEGRETVQIISAEWDQASKEVLMKDPDVLNVINQQRQSGVYAAIVSEIERQRIIGSIPPQTNFLDAYRAVGTQMYSKGAQTQAPTPVARTIPTSTSSAPVNTAKIQATAPAKSTGSGNAKIDPLSLSDEEFRKFMEAQS